MPVNEPIGRAVLYVESTVAPQMLEAFNTWCNSIHHFDTMRIKGFLSMRRFGLVEASMAPAAKSYRILTFYQIADSSAADFSTPEYRQHTTTYVRPPAGVEGNIDFQRTIYERSDVPEQDVQAVGGALVAIRSYPCGETKKRPPHPRCPPGNVLSVYRIHDDSTAGLIINCEDLASARAIYRSALDDSELVSCSTVQLYEQVFPERGALLRDRRFCP